MVLSSIFSNRIIVLFPLFSNRIISFIVLFSVFRGKVALFPKSKTKVFILLKSLGYLLLDAIIVN